MSELTLEVKERTAGGKNVNRRLRAAGQLPAVVYGGDLESKTIQVERRTMQTLLRSTEADNPIFLLQLEGTEKKRHTMIRELQADPITGDMIHVDFLRVSMDEEVTVTVAIELVGVPVGVTEDGGILDFVMREVEVTCLPGDIPQQIEVNVEELHIGDHIEVGDLDVPEGAKIEDDPDRVVVSVHVREELELPEEEEEVEEELLEGEEMEPEVIGKGKAEEEEEEREAAEEG